MGMTEKDSLINAILIEISDDYQPGMKVLKAKLTEILNNFHVSLSDEALRGTDTSTEYLMKKFSDAKKSVGMSDKTIQQYKIAVKILEKNTCKKLADIEPEDITRFFLSYGKTVSDVTLRGKYQLISSIYNYLFTHKYIPFNPILYVEAPRATLIYQKPLTEFDYEKVKKACEDLPKKESLRDTAIVYFLLSTGVRVSELCKVQIKDLDLEKKVCVVMGKGRKQRPVVLNDKTIYRLKLYLNSRKSINPSDPLFSHVRGEELPMTKDGVIVLMAKLRKITGINNLTCHTFRRYYATELRKRGVNIQMIANSLGHANLNQINRYSLYNDQEMLDTIRSSIS